MKAKKNLLSRSISWALLSSFSSFAAIQSVQAETIWLENFDAPQQQGKGAVFESIDIAGITTWSIDVSQVQLSANSDWFFVKDQKFEARDVDGDAIWLSESIDISGKTDVSISVDVATSGTFESIDYFDVEYAIDGGAFVRVENYNGGGSDSHTLIDEINNVTVTHDVTDGSSLQIRLTMLNNAGIEVTSFDNVMVSANASGGDGDGDGGNTGPGLGLGVTISNACFNCPDLTTIKDAGAFDDNAYYSDVIAAIAAGESTVNIHAALNSTLRNSHTQLSYSQVWTALTKTDEDPSNTDNVILIYKGNSIAKMSNGSGSQSNNPDNWNREHVWAKSHGFPSQSQFGYTDVHHLRPSDISVNAARGNLDFDDSDAPLSEAPLNRVDGDSFEPRDSVKGDIARMALYMDVRYDGNDGSMPDLQLANNLTSVGQARLGKLCTLLAWHNDDPVDEFEQRRNAISYEFQGNRSPFIDHPEWVDTLFDIDCAAGGGGGDGGATGGELFISEYVEGGGFNKAVEIYNPTDAAVDLSGYQLALYSNGGTSPSSIYQLMDSIAAKDVVVVVNNNSNVSDALKALADQFSSVANFNGDDYVELRKGDALVDNIGTFGQRTNWGKDKTLVRKPEVTSGDTNRDDAFVVTEQWIEESKDDFSFLGQHNGNSGGGGGGGSAMLGNCGDESINIGAIQGSAMASTMAGQTLVIEGVVTHTVPNLDGYFVQQSAATIDGDVATSDGIFVYHQGLSTFPDNGEHVRVIGEVTEHFTRTQLSAAEHLACGVGEVAAPPVVTLPIVNTNGWEQWEGMQVVFSQDLNVSNSFDLARFGQLTLSHGRLAIPTNIYPANSAQALALKAQNERNRIILDDANNGQNVDDVIFPTGGLSHDNSVRIGDSVSGLNGVLDYSFGEYRVLATTEPAFNQTNPRHALGAPAQGVLRVASMNVLNFFNGDGLGNGFPTSRGADNNDEFDRQSAKIVSAITGLNADVIGLMEIENDGYGTNSALAQLTNMLNTAHGENVYSFVDAGGSQLGSDEITVAMIYRSDRVALMGSAETSSSAPFDFGNRQPLAQTFKHLANDEVLTVAVNHFKSKGGCSSATGANQDQNDGQGCWNAMRTDAAHGLHRWLATDPTDSGDPDMLIIGDLNAYGKEDPINRLTDLGYSNLVAAFGGLGAYSYGFGGQLGYLDHALASTSLADQVDNTQVWHINADETRALDYNTEHKSAQQLSSYFSNDAYRSSDHDPVIIDISLQSTTTIIGDMDGDGDIDRKDVRGFSARLRAGEQFSLDYDFNQDGVVNHRDIRALMSRCTRNRCAVD